MASRIIFIHGAWMTPLCWDGWVRFFEGRGFRCSAPAWPLRDAPIGDLRASPPAGLARLGIADIVDHYAALISAEKTPPILIGHSFGGLFVQILLDRGLGAAGVAIDPAPPKGVSPLRASSIRANAGVLLTWRGWQRIVRMSFAQFQYAFVNAMSRPEQQEVYEKHVVPESGRIFFQTAFAPVDRQSPIAVDFRNTLRRPLLIIAGGADTIVPASVNRVNHGAYLKAGSPTDYKEFAGRCHWTIGQPGWEEVAHYAAGWLAERAMGAGGVS